MRFLTAGESHGRCLVGILEGIPAGLRLDKNDIDQELALRQKGYGRGPRMKIEKDKVEILSGLRRAKTIGSPIALLIRNNDFKINKLPAVLHPRPGHADLAGCLKYDSKDIRDVLERASARETAMRVAIGAICKGFLREFKIALVNHVLRIGQAWAHTERLNFEQIRQRVAHSVLSCADKTAENRMITEIDKAQAQGDSLGGVFAVMAINLPVGLGSYVHWDRRLDGVISGALMSIPAIKGVEIGSGFLGAFQSGSQVQDAIFYNQAKSFYRRTNYAGGLEGGVTNGEPLVVRCAMKPIATLRSPLPSVNIKSKRLAKAAVERADVCAVPAASIVGEAVVSFCLAQAFLEKFGGDSLAETKRNHQGYVKQIKTF
ncbi:MAG: chorismate synthase [Candidatus Omnitrophica bacterium]|nr:chorismate synthase [Candidatus Omnitrophota bacterium]